MFPLLRPGGRVVNLGSMAGYLTRWSQELRDEIMASSLTIEGLEAMMSRFVADCEAGNPQSKGWPGTTYGVSKAAVHALTRIHAKALEPSKVSVNACCPGWCKSDMAGFEKPPKTAEQGADTPLWLALGIDGAPTGRFFTERREASFTGAN
uniref:Carbonyl reductase n=2 Tax=Oxyrrhis marina TaxID=2969 RepID=A0A7S3UQU3_OXYMA